MGYHSKKLPPPVQNYGVTELTLTGLLANIHGFEQKLRNNYYKVIVDHKAIDYMVKSKHQPTTTRLANLLLKLMEYTFDLKYLEGNKLKVSDALSRLYIEEKHKINDVIPLNFLLHYSNRQLLSNYHKAAGIDHLHIIRVNNYLKQEHDMLGRHIHSHSVDIKLETPNQLIRKEKGYHKTHL